MTSALRALALLLVLGLSAKPLALAQATPLWTYEVTTGPASKTFYTVVEDPSGGYYAGGFATNKRNPGRDGLVVRLGEGGDTVWTYRLAGTNGTRGSDATVRALVPVGRDSVVAVYTEHSASVTYGRGGMALLYRDARGAVVEERYVIPAAGQTGGYLRLADATRIPGTTDIVLAGETSANGISPDGAFVARYTLSGERVWASSWNPAPDSIDVAQFRRRLINSVAATEDYVYLTGIYSSVGVFAVQDGAVLDGPSSTEYGSSDLAGRSFLLEDGGEVYWVAGLAFGEYALLTLDGVGVRDVEQFETTTFSVPLAVRREGDDYVLYASTFSEDFRLRVRDGVATTEASFYYGSDYLWSGTFATEFSGTGAGSRTIVVRGDGTLLRSVTQFRNARYSGVVAAIDLDAESAALFAVIAPEGVTERSTIVDLLPPGTSSADGSVRIVVETDSSTAVLTIDDLGVLRDSSMLVEDDYVGALALGGDSLIVLAEGPLVGGFKAEVVLLGARGARLDSTTIPLPPTTSLVTSVPPVALPGGGFAVAFFDYGGTTSETSLALLSPSLQLSGTVSVGENVSISRAYRGLRHGEVLLAGEGLSGDDDRDALVAVDLQTGDKRWVYAYNEPGVFRPAISTLAVLDDGHVAFVTYDRLTNLGDSYVELDEDGALVRSIPLFPSTLGTDYGMPLWSLSLRGHASSLPFAYTRYTETANGLPTNRAALATVSRLSGELSAVAEIPVDNSLVRFYWELADRTYVTGRTYATSGGKYFLAAFRGLLSPVGSPHTGLAEDFRPYPNPARADAVVSFGGSLPLPPAIHLIDYAGRDYGTLAVEGRAVALPADLPAGTYLLRGEHAGRSYATRLIVE